MVATDEDAMTIQISKEVGREGDALRPGKRDGPQPLQRPVTTAREAVRRKVRVGSVAERQAADGDVARGVVLAAADVDEHLELGGHKAVGRRCE